MATSKATARGGRNLPPVAAYVLHSYDWSDSSLVLELFTRELGRVVAVARGAKRPTSGYRAVLLPFHPLMVSLRSSGPPGEGDDAVDLHTLRSVQWQGHGGGAHLPRSALMSGFYLNELMLKGLARQDPHPQLFNCYSNALAGLTDAASDAAHAACLRAFELQWLRDLGLLPDVGQPSVRGAGLVPEQGYLLKPEIGLVAASGGLMGAHWLAVQAALDGGNTLALQQACLTVQAQAAARRALRQGLAACVQYHLGHTPLRTRQVGLEVQRLNAAVQASGALPLRRTAQA